MLHRKRWGCCTDNSANILLTHQVTRFSTAPIPVLAPPKPYNPFTTYNRIDGSGRSTIGRYGLRAITTGALTASQAHTLAMKKPLQQSCQRGYEAARPLSLHQASFSEARAFRACHDDVIKRAHVEQPKNLLDALRDLTICMTRLCRRRGVVMR